MTAAFATVHDLSEVAPGPDAPAHEASALAERAVVTAMLWDPACAPRVAEIVAPPDYADPRLRLIAAAIYELAAAGEPVDPPSLVARLERMGSLGQAGGEGQVAELADDAATSAGVEHHARQVRRAALERELRRSASRVARGDLGVANEVAALRDLLAALDGEGGAYGLRPLSAEEYAGDLAPEALVEGLVYEASTHLVTGASKAGKTWWALQMLACLTAGCDFLGLRTTECPTLLVSLELSAGMVRERLRVIEASTGIPAPVPDQGFAIVAPTAQRVPTLDLSADSGATALAAVIRSTGARVVVLDTLYRFLGGLDPNSNAEMGPVFGRLNRVAQETGAAILAVDHVRKGEASGPVSHSALGAQVKGGASRVIVALRRTSRTGGGAWEVDVESHFGSWDEPLHYQRPTLPDGTLGSGCALVSATQAHGLDKGTLRDLFARFGELDEQGRRCFTSKRKLTEALKATGHATGQGDAGQVIRAIERDLCRPDGATWGEERPIDKRDGPRNSTVYTWRVIE